jgi:hypothetical protein
VKPWDERWLFVRPVRGFLEKKRDNVTRKIKEKPGTLLTPNGIIREKLSMGDIRTDEKIPAKNHRRLKRKGRPVRKIRYSAGKSVSRHG